MNMIPEKSISEWRLPSCCRHNSLARTTVENAVSYNSSIVACALLRPELVYLRSLPTNGSTPYNNITLFSSTYCPWRSLTSITIVVRHNTWECNIKFIFYSVILGSVVCSLVIRWLLQTKLHWSCIRCIFVFYISCSESAGTIKFFIVNIFQLRFRVCH